jgi:hypothetical protein
MQEDKCYHAQVAVQAAAQATFACVSNEWVRVDSTQSDHNKSAYPPISDMGTDILDGSEVPTADKSRG